MTTTDRTAAALSELRRRLESAGPAPHEGPAFTGSHNCEANMIRDYQRRRRGHWFDRETMRFFGTIIQPSMLDLDGAGVTLFVTSEKPPHGRRAYCLRAYLWGAAEVVSLTDVASIATRGTAERIRDAVADAMRGAQ